MSSDSHHSSTRRPSTPHPAFLVTGKLDRGIRKCNVLDEDSIKSNDNNLAKGMAMVHASELLAHRGEVDDAVASLNRAIELFRSWPMKLGDVYLAMGHIYMKQLNYHESNTQFQNAKVQYVQAFEDKRWIEQAIFPEQKIHYYLQNRLCCVLSHLGSIAFAQNDYRKANDYFHQALDEAKKSAILGLYIDRNFPIKDMMVVKEARLNVANCFNNIASLYAEQNQRPAAIKHYNDALSLQIRELGEDNDSVAKTLYNIGTLHYRSLEYNLALKSYKQVLKMRRMLFGPRHISNAEILIDIATAHEKNEEIDMALSALKAANSIISLHYGNKHTDMGRIAFRVGAMHARRGNLDFALESFNRALGIYKEVGLGDSHSLMQNIRDAIQYVNGQEKEPVMSAPEFISTLSDDKCRVPAIADSFSSSEFSDVHDDNRDDNVDDIDRINPSVGTVYV